MISVLCVVNNSHRKFLGLFTRSHRARLLLSPRGCGAGSLLARHAADPAGRGADPLDRNAPRLGVGLAPAIPQHSATVRPRRNATEAEAKQKALFALIVDMEVMSSPT